MRFLAAIFNVFLLMFQSKSISQLTHKPALQRPGEHKVLLNPVVEVFQMNAFENGANLQRSPLYGILARLQTWLG